MAKTGAKGNGFKVVNGELVDESSCAKAALVEGTNVLYPGKERWPGHPGDKVQKGLKSARPTPRRSLPLPTRLGMAVPSLASPGARHTRPRPTRLAITRLASSAPSSPDPCPTCPPSPALASPHPTWHAAAPPCLRRPAPPSPDSPPRPRSSLANRRRIVATVTEPKRLDVAMEGLVAGIAGLVGLISPDAGVAAAFATPAAVAGAKDALSRFYNRQQARQASVLRFAAQQAGIEPEELERRCEEDSRLDELLQVVMAASADTAMRKKLVAYALALADGVKSSGEPSYWQSALVNAMRDLDHQHLALLERFTWTRARLGLDFANDEVAPYLDAGQVEQIGADIAPLSSVLAVLLGHGLLEQEFVGGGMAFRGTSRGLWRLTPFGAQVLELLRDLGERLRTSEGPS